MPDNPALIEYYEDELWQVINRMHRAGLSYANILFIMEEALKSLKLQAYCENWLANITISPQNITGSLE